MNSAHRNPVPTGRRNSNRGDGRDVTVEVVGELVLLVTKGDSAAMNELVRRFDRKIHGVARRIGLSHSDAEDAAQLTWMRFIDGLDGIRDLSCIASWLTTTAQRESIRLATRDRRQIPFVDPLSASGRDHARGDSVDAVDDSLLADYGPELVRALDCLPPRSQQLIRLLYSDASPTYAEVSQILGIPIGSIGPMRQRALALLRRELDAGVRGRVARPRLAADPAGSSPQAAPRRPATRRVSARNTAEHPGGFGAAA